MPIYVTRPSMPELKDYIEEIKPIFESRIITNMGPVYKKFQSLLIQYLDVKELSLFSNGHFALEMAIQALGLKEKGEELGGGEVITTPFTFVSTVHAISRNNLKPVFCDIRKSDYCIDPDKIERLITDKTVAILPVHVYGNVCDVHKIENIAEKYGLKVIYDGAHAFGETFYDKGIGNFGDATMFSFHATKVFNCIEGGAIAFSDKRYGVPLHELKNFGIHSEDSVAGIGGNAKLDEFRAAMGICNLKNVDASISARKLIFEQYMERLDGVTGLVLNTPQKGVKPNYSYFPVYFDRKILGFSRDDVYRVLRENEIYARKYFYPAVNDLDCYEGRREDPTPLAHDVSLNILTLPIYEGLSRVDVDRICDIIMDSVLDN